MSLKPLVIDKGNLRQASSTEELGDLSTQRIDRLESIVAALVRCMCEMGVDVPDEALEALEESAR